MSCAQGDCHAVGGPCVLYARALSCSRRATCPVRKDIVMQ